MTAAARRKPQRAAAAAQPRFSARNTPLPWQETTIGCRLPRSAAATIGAAGSSQWACTRSNDPARRMRRIARTAATTANGVAT